MISSGRISMLVFGATRALIVSPHRSSGTPMTATSAMAGWSDSAFSTSAGVHVLAARDDHVRHPVGEDEIAVLVEKAGVARPEPPVGAERPGRLVRLAPVAISTVLRWPSISSRWPRKSGPTKRSLASASLMT
jgi:hypothetical protein